MLVSNIIEIQIYKPNNKAVFLGVDIGFFFYQLIPPNLSKLVTPVLAHSRGRGLGHRGLPGEDALRQLRGLLGAR